VDRFRSAAGCLGGARGWNADQFGGPALAGPLVRHPWWVCGTSGRWGVGTVGTLLGPEGAGDLLSLAQDHPWSQTSRHRSGHGGAWWGGGCLLVENCTVDASIFSGSNALMVFGSVFVECLFVCWLSC